MDKVVPHTNKTYVWCVCQEVEGIQAACPIYFLKLLKYLNRLRGSVGLWEMLSGLKKKKKETRFHLHYTKAKRVNQEAMGKDGHSMAFSTSFMPE